MVARCLNNVLKNNFPQSEGLILGRERGAFRAKGGLALGCVQTEAVVQVDAKQQPVAAAPLIEAIGGRLQRALQTISSPPLVCAACRTAGTSQNLDQ